MDIVAVIGVDDQTAMGDAVTTLQRQIEIPVEAAQLGAGAGQDVLMKVLLVAPLQLAAEISQSILLLGAVAGWRRMLQVQLARIEQLARRLAVVRLADSLRRGRQVVNAKGGYICGKLATHMRGMWSGQGEVEERGIELGALAKGDLALNTARVDEGSGEQIEIFSYPIKVVLGWDSLVV